MKVSSLIALASTFFVVLLANPVALEKRQEVVDPWSPPSAMVQPLNEVWAKYLQINPAFWTSFRNFGFDQIIATGGNINYCVRWESTDVLTSSQRDLLETEVQRQFNKWISWLSGFNNWPYPTVNVKVVGYAAANRNLLGFSEKAGQTFYLNTKDSAGIPECDPRCGRFFHQDNNYSQCPTGAAGHYDQSLWLTKGMGGGAGGDWGQRLDSQYFTSTMGQENIHIYLHEIGHTFGLMDFYDWTPTGQPNFVMKAGSATRITDFDGWMLRDAWRHIRYRYPGIPAPGTATTSRTTTTTTTSRTTTTTSRTTTTTSRTTTTAAATSPASGACSARWGQCGGISYTGATCCQAGSTCTYNNDYYSQCI